MSAIFWLSVAVIAYVYVGYPLLLRAWARLRPKPYIATGTPIRGVSIVIAARDEGARLGARIENLLSLDYPANRRQIIVVCDGCTDDTDDVLARYSGVVEPVRVPPSGKAASLNAGVARARFEILVFADARQVFAPDAVRELVAPFQDPAVGAVTGATSPSTRPAASRGARSRSAERAPRPAGAPDDPAGPPSESTRRPRSLRRVTMIASSPHARANGSTQVRSRDHSWCRTSRRPIASRRAPELRHRA